MYQVLHALAFRARVIIAVTFQQVDNAPHAKASAQRDNQYLQSVDCAVEIFHTLI